MNQANIGSSAGSAGRPLVTQPGAPDHIQQYLTFVLSGEVFAIGILVCTCTPISCKAWARWAASL